MSGKRAKRRRASDRARRALRDRLLLFAIVAALIGCGRSCCLGPDDRELSAAVAAVVKGDEPAAYQAEQELVRAGRRAVAILETGLYSADPAGRARVVRALVRVGQPAALPILRYLARRDPSERVRQAARRGVRTLAAAPRADAGARAGPRRGTNLGSLHRREP